MPAQAQVSVRFSVQDQEVVRKALQDLGKDGEAALKKLELAGKQTPAGLSAVSSVVHEAKQKVAEASGELGIFGTALGALGPVGLVAAGAIGAVVAVLYEAQKRAGEFGDKAIVLNTFAEAAGLSARNVQALGAEGAKFALEGEKIASGIEKFSVNVQALRKGTGPLFEELTRINPVLRDQLAAVRDTASAYDVAGRAINQTKGAFERNELARALFGRGAAAQGLLAGDIARQGGLAEVTKEFDHAGKSVDDGLLKSVGRLRAEIKELGENTRMLNDSLFSEAVLEREKQFAEKANEIARALVAMRRGGAAIETDMFGLPLSPDDARRERERRSNDMLEEMATGRVNAQIAGQGGGRAAEEQLALEQVKAGAEKAAEGHEKLGEAVKKSTPPLEEQLAVMRLHVAVLGSAITPTEQLRLKQLELAVAVKDNHATVQEAARSQRAYALALDQTQLSARERLGLASREEISNVALRQLADERAKGFVRNADEMARAEAGVAKQVRLTAEQVQVTAAALPGLKRFELDATDGMKALDQVTTGSLTAAGNALVEFGTGAKDSGHAFGDFAKSVIRDIESMLVKMYLLAPLAKALQPGAGGLPGLSGLFGFGSSDSASASIFDSAKVAASAFGNVMTSRGPMVLHRYAAGGVATSPQVSIFGEGRQNEAYVPLADGRSIPVSISMPGNSGSAAPAAPASGDVHVHNYAGADVQAQRVPNQAGGTDLHIVVGRAMNGLLINDIANAGPVSRALEDRFRLNRVGGLS